MCGYVSVLSTILYSYHVFFITTERIKIVRDLLSNRFEKLKPVPGTRFFHHFRPTDENCIQVKR